MRLFNYSARINVQFTKTTYKCLFSSKVQSLYYILNIPKDFTPEELKTARLTLTKKYHPDVNDGKDIQFMEIQKAAEILGDPVKRHDYDKMTANDLKRFELKWSQQYGSDKKVSNNFIEKVTKLLFGKNDEPIMYDQKHNTSNQTGRFTRAQIILDASYSMYGVYSTTVGVKKTFLKEELIDGIKMDICDFPTDSETQKLLNSTKRMYKSIKAINNMLYDIISKDSLKYVGMKTFSSQEKVINDECSPTDLVRTLRQMPLEDYHVKNNKETLLYDVIANSLDDFSHKLSDTLFVVLTDGYDTGSMTSIDNLVKLIKSKKCVNIVIISLELTKTTDLQKIVDSAMFGKLLKVGDSFEFKTVSDAFSATNEIVLKQSIDIAKTFGL